MDALVQFRHFAIIDEAAKDMIRTAVEVQTGDGHSVEETYAGLIYIEIALRFCLSRSCSVASKGLS